MINIKLKYMILKHPEVAELTEEDMPMV